MAKAGRTGGLISLLSSSGQLWTKGNPAKFVISKPMITKFGNNILWILFIRNLRKNFMKYFDFESYLTISKVKEAKPIAFQDGVGFPVQRSFLVPVVPSVWFLAMSDGLLEHFVAKTTGDWNDLLQTQTAADTASSFKSQLQSARRP